VFLKNNMKMIIALTGSSCVGKSAVARQVGEALNVQVRHCGEVIKTRAKKLGVELSSLSLDEHKSIDAETQAFVLNSNDAVVEGTFLGHVLCNMENVLIVRLTCKTAERERRYIKRSDNKSEASQLLIRDQADDALSQLLYKKSTQKEDFATIDTTDLSIEDVVERIITLTK
jgi:cytidylate kinase